MSYYVYKHTFPNGKIYIGITGRVPNVRWGNNGINYLSKNKNGKYNQPIIANAILKYGWENIDHKILHKGLTKEEAERKEIKLIAKYKSNDIEFGYNVQNGGNSIGKHSEETKKKIGKANKGKNNGNCGKSTSQKQKDALAQSNKKRLSKQVRCVETNTIYTSMSEASEKTGILTQGISRCCRGERKTCGGYHWEFVNENELKCKSNKLKKRVRCIETNKVYLSIRSASRKTGICRSSILRACHGELHTAGGYHWRFVGVPKAIKPKVYKKEIICVETGIIYDSKAEASRQMNICSSSISKCCRGLLNTAGGYHWEYVNESTQ